MKIYLTRHGQTDWNKNERIQTHSNGFGNFLNEQGKQQARAIGDILKDQPINEVYYSSLRRSKETAEIVANIIGCRSPVEDKRIRDVALGFLDGFAYDEIKIKFPKIFEAREKDKFNYKVPNLFPEKHFESESMKEGLFRIKPLIDKVLSENKNAVIVGHKAINRVIIYYLFKKFEFMDEKDVVKINMPHLIIYKFEIKNNFFEVEHNIGQGWVKGLSFLF